LYYEEYREMRANKRLSPASGSRKKYARPADRGLGPEGGAWNLKQAAAWCGIGENYLRTMAKNREIPCAYFIGRRILLPRQGFVDWFNNRRASGSSA
jgi:hypothetical protein